MIRVKSPQSKNITNSQRINLATKKNAELINNKLNQLLFKKLRYTFQVLKQFYLFPEGSSSSVMSIEKYDKLIFSDEAIHTLVKKLETKVLETKIWGFLNLKMLKTLKKAANITKKLNVVVTKKKKEFINFSFERIKYVSIRYRPIKKLKDEGSVTRIPSESFISSGEKTVISITEEISYKIEPRVYVHRGSRSRSRSISSNNSYTRVLRQEEIRVYPKEVLGNVGNIREVTPKVVITKITERSPAKNYYEVDQVKREYRNCYRVSPTRISVANSGLDRLQETNEENKSYSKEKKSIKIIKSPSKKNIEEKQVENRNNYMEHLENLSPRTKTIRIEHSNTRVTQIRR